MLSQPPNIYDKLDALREGTEHDLAFWRVMTWAMVTALIFAAGVFVYRWLMKKRALEADRRAQLTSGKRKNIEVDDLPKVNTVGDLGSLDFIASAAAERILPIASIAAGTRIALFWNVGELRCGSKGILESGADGRVIARLDSDSAPRNGDATLLCPEAEGHVLYYRVQIKPGSEDTTRSLATKGPKPASRVHHRYRAHSTLKAAALRSAAADGAEREAILLRVQDLSFDGLGLLSELPLEVGESLRLRLELPDYLEPLSIKGRVAWGQIDASGLWRGGMELAHDDIEQRLMLADYLLSTIRAESGEIILEKRRRNHTPVRPIPLEPTP